MFTFLLSLDLLLAENSLTSFRAIFSEVNDIEASFAFAGSVIFIVISKEYHFFEKILLFFISFLIGINSSEFVLNIINLMISEKFIVDRSIGALLASALSVNVIAFLISIVKNPVEFVAKLVHLLNKVRGGKNES